MKTVIPWFVKQAIVKAIGRRGHGEDVQAGVPRVDWLLEVGVSRYADLPDQGTC